MIRATLSILLLVTTCARGSFALEEPSAGIVQAASQFSLSADEETGSLALMGPEQSVKSGSQNVGRDSARAEVQAYLDLNGARPVGHIRFYYGAENWLFIERVQFIVGDQDFSLESKWKTGVKNGVHESSDLLIDETAGAFLETAYSARLADAPITMRYVGARGSRDYVLEPEVADSIATVYWLLRFSSGELQGRFTTEAGLTRIWNRNDGGKVDAKIIHANRRHVTFRRTDDRGIFMIAVDQLSEEDQAFIRGWLRGEDSRSGSE